ncbi:MAG: VOC family protein [Moritella sp.]|uniref:VOC family protein n=1 Tax=Moritella sp. TaxID=78556 RepID=UPI00216F8ECA|nr:VOC family protein [Moritella sp.]MBL1417574.1 VOC family protein [Moritella sp.]
MALDKLHAITDICILVEDIDRTVEFYTKKLGFKLRRKADGFADFHSPTITLAAWEIDHIHKYADVSNKRSPPGANKTCIAVEVESTQILDDLYNELVERGVKFQNPPKDYMWNAYCTYFSDPDDTLWEIYCWTGGGADEYHETHKD